MTAKTVSTAKDNAPKYSVRDGLFCAVTSEGEVKIPLQIKTKTMRQMNSLEDLDAVFYLVDNLGDKATAEILDELPFEETADVIKEYFEAFEAKNGATPGE